MTDLATITVMGNGEAVSCGVAPPEIPTGDIYRGIIPFVGMQLIALVLCFWFPQLALWLPQTIGR